MANYTTTANVILSVNGKQAQKMLAQLQRDAAALERKLAKAAVAGDKASMKKLQRELNSTNSIIRQMQGSAKSAEQVLARLDKATPKELSRTLRTLQQQLNGIQRGSAAWNAQIAKIKAVKAEIMRLNASIAVQKTMWERMNIWLNNCQTAIFGLVGALTGLIMAGRRAVKSYADMEEAMAMTVKYTRMTAGEVEELNEIFKKMDTRIPREQLNLLAQEAGRLGYNTVESVKEYVEAASIINVALVDLGEGATQTIAKLSNIFGIEEIFGVREAMLKVGSTVNHLSQNCTASKPFIVEFTKRLAGIGSTAKMTVPEIMALAATLDAHGQKVEMSATAVQRTIMSLYKNPAEMAEKVGLDAKEFTTALNRNTTEGLVMFLDALNKIGEDKALAVLSPLFKDLGLDGARVSAVLANLSSHLDFLRWQLGEAATAFDEGTSASREYAIFNNTVQAQLEKAKKKVAELAVELGEKLFPLMRHIYRSSSAFLRVLNAIITFMIENRKAIANLITVIGTYYGWLLLVKTATAGWHAVLAAGKAIMGAYKAALALCRAAAIAFTQGLGAATNAMRALNATVKASTLGVLLSLIAAVALAVKSLADRTSEYTKKMREALGVAANYAGMMEKEMLAIDLLFGKLEACEKGTKEYNDARNEIVKQYGAYLKGLVDEKNEITNLAEAYQRLAAAARISAKERAFKTAREAVQDNFEGALKELSSKLNSSLVKEGVSQKDAARLTNSVIIQIQTRGTLSDEVVAELEAIKGNIWDAYDMTEHPVNLVNRFLQQYSEYMDTMAGIDEIEREENPLAGYSATELERIIEDLQERVANNEGARIILGINQPNPTVKEISASEVQDLLEEAKARLSAMEAPKPSIVGGNPDFDPDEYLPYESEADRKKREAAERREAIKAKKEFKDALNEKKGEWESGIAQNTTDYSEGLKSWSQFLLDRHKLDVGYYKGCQEVYKKFHLTEDEDYQELLKKKSEMYADWQKKNSAMKVEEAKMNQKADETQAQMDFYTPGDAIYQNEEALQQRLFETKMKYLRKMQNAYKEESKEWHDYDVQIKQEEEAEQLRRQKLLAQRIAEWRKKYEYQDAKKRLDIELELLQMAFDKKLITEEQYLQAKKDLQKKYADDYLPDSAKPRTDSPKAQDEQKQKDLDKAKSLYEQGLLSEEQYEQAKERIEKSYFDKSIERIRKYGSEETNQLLDIYEAWKKFFDSTEEDGAGWANRLASLASAVFAVMSAGMQQASELIQAQADLDVAKAEKKYDREIELAEGNSYMTAKLEKEKEAKIAAIKNEANRKAFSMKIIQAVAQTATNALNAYGSAAQVPMIGYLLAPIAASMAIAAGAVQIATIKKQQKASEAQGYSKGGFTPEGGKDEPVGIVHAGEWVASQKLTRNPKTRPLLEALDKAQRSNTIGSLTYDAVSFLMPATAGTTQGAILQSPQPNVIVNVPPQQRDKGIGETLARLNERLSQPFVTVNTVSGDHGIQQAQDEYDRLMRNKSPKSRK